MQDRAREPVVQEEVPLPVGKHPRNLCAEHGIEILGPPGMLPTDL